MKDGEERMQGSGACTDGEDERVREGWEESIQSWADIQ